MSVPVLLVQETEMGSLKVAVAEKMPPCETQASRDRSNLRDGLCRVSYDTARMIWAWGAHDWLVGLVMMAWSTLRTVALMMYCAIACATG